MKENKSGCFFSEHSVYAQNANTEMEAESGDNDEDGLTSK